MKKFTKYLMIFALVFGLTLSLTMTLLTDTTSSATNVFTSSRGIDIELREPAWDGYDFSEAWPGGTSPKSDDVTLGYNIANEYLPGDTVPKDPTIKAMTGSDNTYVAMKLTYKVNDVVVPYATFATYLRDDSIVFDTGAAVDEWSNESTVPANNDFFVFNSYLVADSAQATTSPLFTQVLISFGLVPDGSGNLPKLEIDATAYGVQISLPAGTDKATALKTLAGYPAP